MEQGIKLLTKRDVCGIMKISIGKLDGLIKDNKIKYLKLQKSVRFREADINTYIEKHYKQEKTAQVKATQILDMLSDRSGFGDVIGNLDEDILEEVVEEIANIIK